MSSNASPPGGAELDPTAFCRACGKYATGVTVVTVLDDAGHPHGMTANSFTSVSLNPPMVLFCVDERAEILAHFKTGKHIGINVLSEEHERHSMHFARAEDRFGSVEWYPGRTGVPTLPGMLATLECAITETVRAGDHTVVLAAVLHLTFREGKPLLFFDSRYRKLDSTG